MTQPVDLARVLSSVTEPWSPRTVATMNDDDVRVVRTHGEFTWHSHPDTDELFLVLAEPSVTVDTGDTPSHLTAVRRGVDGPA